MMAAKGQGRLTGRAVALIAVGAFLVIMIANGALVVTALRSWTGLAVSSPYEHGLHFNRTLQAARDQAALGWTGRIAYDGALLSFDLAGRDGMPIDGAEVKAWISRPVATGHDVSVDLSGQGKGRYMAHVQAPASGQWDVRIDARTAEGSWHATTRMVVP